MIRSNYTCPDFREYMTKFVEEMMLLTNDGITFYLIQPILSDHGIEDTEGAAYWYLRTYMLHLKPNQLPNEVREHSWAFTHYLYASHSKHTIRLKLEKEHIRDIARWTEMTFIGSEVRKQIRRIDRELRSLTEA